MGTDSDSNRVIWRDTIDAPAGNLRATQVQISLRIKGTLVPALGLSTNDTPTPPRNEEAYRLYLKSVLLSFDPGPNATATAMLERSVAADPSYPPTWLALSRRYYVEVRYASGDAKATARYDNALQRAVALDPESIPAGGQLVIRQVERGALTEAYQRGAQLVRSRPDSADAHFALSYVLRFGGVLDEAARECDAAWLLDPQTTTAGLLVRGRLHPARRVRASRELFGTRSRFRVRACAVDSCSRSPRTGAGGQCPRTAEDGAMEELWAIAAGYCSYPTIESDPLLGRIREQPEFSSIRSAARHCRDHFLSARGRP